MTPSKQLEADKSARLAIAKAVEDPDFRRGVGLVFQAYVWRLPGADSPQQGWNSNCRRQGAREFIEALESIANPPKPTEKLSHGLEATSDGSMTLPTVPHK